MYAALSQESPELVMLKVRHDALPAPPDHKQLLSPQGLGIFTLAEGHQS